MPPLDARGLFGPDRAALIQLLESLAPAEWELPTVCAGWDVRDVALHILGGDLGNVARRRDGSRSEPAAGEALPTFINRINEEWVAATRRLSPRLICELLAFSGPPVFAHLEALDPDAPDGHVSWARLEPAPNRLDVAREYMERWVHQQHIRDATGRPGQTDERFVAPVTAASIWAVPRALAGLPEGSLAITITGTGGGDWAAVYEEGGWRLREAAGVQATCRLSVPSDTWWRLVTRGIPREQAASRARIEGEPGLALAALQAVAIIA